MCGSIVVFCCMVDWGVVFWRELFNLLLIMTYDAYSFFKKIK
jgi:hypothetical protein